MFTYTSLTQHRTIQRLEWFTLIRCSSTTREEIKENLLFDQDETLPYWYRPTSQSWGIIKKCILLKALTDFFIPCNIFWLSQQELVECVINLGGELRLNPSTFKELFINSSTFKVLISFFFFSSTFQTRGNPVQRTPTHRLGRDPYRTADDKSWLTPNCCFSRQRYRGHQPAPNTSLETEGLRKQSKCWPSFWV